jgi:hypothetical protein
VLVVDDWVEVLPPVVHVAAAAAGTDKGAGRDHGLGAAEGEGRRGEEGEEEEAPAVGSRQDQRAAQRLGKGKGAEGNAGGEGGGGARGMPRIVDRNPFADF